MKKGYYEIKHLGTSTILQNFGNGRRKNWASHILNPRKMVLASCSSYTGWSHCWPLLRINPPAGSPASQPALSWGSVDQMNRRHLLPEWKLLQPWKPWYLININFENLTKICMSYLQSIWLKSVHPKTRWVLAARVCNLSTNSGSSVSSTNHVLVLAACFKFLESPSSLSE